MISVSVCVKHCDWERDPRLPVVRRESSRGARSGRCVGSAVPVPGLYLRYNNIMLNNNVSFIVFSIQLYRYRNSIGLGICTCSSTESRGRHAARGPLALARVSRSREP